MRKNVELVPRARAAVGEEGDVMVGRWMALAEAFEPYNVYWIEGALPPGYYESFGRLGCPSRPPGS